MVLIGINSCISSKLVVYTKIHLQMLHLHLQLLGNYQIRSPELVPCMKLKMHEVHLHLHLQRELNHLLQSSKMVCAKVHEQELHLQELHLRLVLHVQLELSVQKLKDRVDVQNFHLIVHIQVSL